MYYKVKVYSAEDSTKRNDFFVKETLPYVDRKVLEEFLQKATCYQVKVTPLPHVTQLKKKYKAWDSIDLEHHIRTIKFYALKEYEVNDWTTVATFYKVQPFDIENELYYGVWYSFCKRPNYTCESILDTLFDIGLNAHLSRCGDPYVRDMKLSFSYDGFGHVHLNKLLSTHKEVQKKQLYC